MLQTDSLAAPDPPVRIVLEHCVRSALGIFCLELKHGKNRRSERQVAWQKMPFFGTKSEDVIGFPNEARRLKIAMFTDCYWEKGHYLGLCK